MNLSRKMLTKKVKVSAPFQKIRTFILIGVGFNASE